MRFITATLLVEDHGSRRHGKVAPFQTCFDVDVHIPQSSAFANDILLTEVGLFCGEGAAGIHAHIDLCWSRDGTLKVNRTPYRARGCRIHHRELGLRRSLTGVFLRRHWASVLTAADAEANRTKGK